MVGDAEFKITENNVREADQIIVIFSFIFHFPLETFSKVRKIQEEYAKSILHFTSIDVSVSENDGTSLGMYVLRCSPALVQEITSKVKEIKTVLVANTTLSYIQPPSQS